MFAQVRRFKSSRLRQFIPGLRSGFSFKPLLFIFMKRFPGCVYNHGAEPDPRFSLANERTFLAWVRTSLAFVAGAVALRAFDLNLPGGLTRLVSVIMLCAAIILPVAAWFHWVAAERAMRRGDPLPGSFVLPVLVGVVIVLAGVLLYGEL